MAADARTSWRRWMPVFAALGSVVVLALVVAGSGAPDSSTGRPAWVTAAITGLGRLPIHRASSMATYSRAAFGPAWEDVDGNHCDTRDDVLRRDLEHVVLKSGSACIVTSGVLHDPYTGKTIAFVRGPETSGAVQIDHVVALGDAWRTGASLWTPAVRVKYANDSFVLLAVDGSANEAKGDADAAEWLPRPSYRCHYVAKQVSIKTRYQLWTTAAEHAAMKNVLDKCG